MSKIRRTSAMLFIPGVLKKDCKTADDMMEERLRCNMVIKDTRVFDQIPILFTTLDRWPTSTNLMCWWCHRAFRDRPWFVPKSIEPNVVQPTDNRACVISPEGNFCTAHCAAAFITAHYYGADRYNRHTMLKYVYRVFTGKNVVEILPSPPPYELLNYGGHLTDLEYSTRINKLNIHSQEVEDNSFANICRQFIRNSWEWPFRRSFTRPWPQLIFPSYGRGQLYFFCVQLS